MGKTLDDFRAMSLDELNVWISSKHDRLLRLREWILNSEPELRLAYRVLKEKMGK